MLCVLPSISHQAVVAQHARAGGISVQQHAAHRAGLHELPRHRALADALHRGHAVLCFPVGKENYDVTDAAL